MIQIEKLPMSLERLYEFANQTSIADYLTTASKTKDLSEKDFYITLMSLQLKNRQRKYLEEQYDKR